VTTADSAHEFRFVARSFTSGLTQASDLSLARDIARFGSLSRHLAHHLARLRNLAYDVDAGLDPGRTRAQANDLAKGLARTRDQANDLAKGLARTNAHDPELASCLERARDYASRVASAMSAARDLHRPNDIVEVCDRASRLAGACAGVSMLAYDLAIQLHSEAQPATAIADDEGEGRLARRIAPLAGRLVTAAAQMLPAADRSRFAAEYRSELWHLAAADEGRWKQLKYAARQLTRAVPLRLALVAARGRKATP
jgi:hypothetical protein